MRSSLRWTSHNLQTRQRLLPRLLALLRLHHVPTHTLQVHTRMQDPPPHTHTHIHICMVLFTSQNVLCMCVQALARTENLLSGDQLCVSLVSDAVSRQTQLSGLLPDARPATTESYIYIHKTEENGDIHHSFCYCLDTDQWRELPQGQGVGFSMTPDPSGSSLTSYAEKVYKHKHTCTHTQAVTHSGVVQLNLRFDQLSLFYISSPLFKLFVTGGCRGNCCRTVRLHVAEPFHDATAEVWCYCPVTHTCTPAPDMGKPRTMHTAITTLDRLYVLGGRTRGEREGTPSLMEVRMKMMMRMMIMMVLMMMMIVCRWSTTTPWPKPGPPSALCPLLSTTQVRNTHRNIHTQMHTDTQTPTHKYRNPNTHTHTYL